MKVICYRYKRKYTRLVQSYLNICTQFISYNNAVFEVKIISHGSILGPLLFILYLKDFSRVSDIILFSILFADDTMVSIEGTITTISLHF